MNNHLFDLIPLDFFTPNKTKGISNVYNLLKHAENHYKRYGSFVTDSNTKTSISLPSENDSKYFPYEIQKYIFQNYNTSRTFNFIIRERKITLVMHFMNKSSNFNIKKYITGLELWFSLMDLIAPKNINKTLKVNIYLTPFEKKMPSHSENFTSSHINSALTYVCLESGEITIYRKEEWFKVLLHECLHSYCLDFSNQDQRKIEHCLFKYFPISLEEPMLSETYAETWAEILNCALISYCETDHSLRTFSLYINFYMQVEIVHSIFQANKILSRYNLSFQTLREKKIKWNQETHVFEYHILKTILLFSFDSFIVWCNKHNGNNLLPFKKDNLISFCDLMIKCYESPDFHRKIKKIIKRTNGNSLRMSIVDM